MKPLTRKLALAALAGTFVAGAVAGGVVGYQWKRLTRPPSPSRGSGGDMQQRLLGWFHRELQLRPDQTNQIDPILLETGRRMREVHQETTRKSREVMDETDQKLLPFLDAEQRNRLAEMRRKAQAGPHRRPHSHPEAPPTPPPGR